MTFMLVQLTRPELQKFILDQVSAGNYSSAEAAVEAAVEQMMQDDDDLDEETIAAIQEADAQYEAGQYVEWQHVRDKLRNKYTGK